MHNHCINQLLNLEGVVVKKIIHADSFVKIYLETKPSQQICLHCGASTKKSMITVPRPSRIFPFS